MAAKPYPDSSSKPGDAARPARRADYYDDPTYDYTQYWPEREYEHAAEEIALRRLLRGKHAALAVDIGGGYGRLSTVLARYADRVILAEPSEQQLKQAKKHLQSIPNVEPKKLPADSLGLASGTVGLALMIRVVHHLPDPAPELAELARVLSTDGYAVIEMANYAHARNRLRHLLRGQKLPIKAVDIRSPENQHADEIPFVNHNPYTFMRQLAHAGLKVERTISVSNLRSQTVKRLLPKRLLLLAERQLQVPLGRGFFGPSIFFLVRKAD